jgi:signal transduction histidine kinase
MDFAVACGVLRKTRVSPASVPRPNLFTGFATLGLIAGAALVLCTRRRAAEAARHETEGFKDTFLASVSHELRTPLNAIVGWARVLRTRSLSEADREHALDAIDRNVRAETQLVADLLDEARLSRGRVELSARACDLNEMIRHAAHTLRLALRARNVRVDLRLGSADLYMHADETLFEQAIWRLLSNAIHASRPGGTIRVETARVGSEARIRVRDFGDGFDRALLPRVFDAFRQVPLSVRRPGLGLGLSLVKHVVELHGGAVEAASGGRGAGATFTIRLPAARRVIAG